MYQLLQEDLARAHQQALRQQARQSGAARQVLRLARAEREAARAQEASERAQRRLVALSA